MRMCSPIPSPSKTKSRVDARGTSPCTPLNTSSRDDSSKSPIAQRSVSPFAPCTFEVRDDAPYASSLLPEGAGLRSFRSPSVSPPLGGSFTLNNTNSSVDEFWVLEEAEVYARMSIEMR